ncbi:type II toxin-antitoxin system HicA family toxin [Lentilitoribacter sp. Alg239-R112]|uniref:type II toxin-antitoxin system HicA family toxin n=1 Tax=Lentilitoribacter sp. Alg239-R112 TaxID=2305987 RepID=UPI0013A69C7B|nr:type II toxin-antitoxin system HicA family toxin [Lentilitoribacter sp. Alg239-R112]
MNGFYKQVTQLLSAAGYSQVKGGKGSHEKWSNENTQHLTTVPKNLKSRHTANSILKDCGVNVKV